jgi:hypothetical protein
MVKGEQGFPILSARPHPPFFVRVLCRAEPDTAPSPIFLVWGGAAFAEGSWRALVSLKGKAISV